MKAYPKNKKQPVYYKYIGESNDDFTHGRIYQIVNDKIKFGELYEFINNSGRKGNFISKRQFTKSIDTAFRLQTAREKLSEKATKKVNKKVAKTKVKTAPRTLFGMQIRHNEKAHRFSISMAMSGVNTDIPTADLILRIFDKMNEMGGKFDLNTACDLKNDVVKEYDDLQEQFEKLTNKNK